MTSDDDGALSAPATFHRPPSSDATTCGEARGAPELGGDTYLPVDPAALAAELMAELRTATTVEHALAMVTDTIAHACRVTAAAELHEHWVAERELEDRVRRTSRWCDDEVAEAQAELDDTLQERDDLRAALIALKGQR